VIITQQRGKMNQEILEMVSRKIAAWSYNKKKGSNMKDQPMQGRINVLH
jgi:hypothetical protein